MRNGELESMKKVKFKMTGNASEIEKSSESSCLCASVLKKDAGVVEGDFNTEAQRLRGTEFKMTEMGLIPEDWEVKRLGDVSSNFNYGVGAEAVPYIEGPRYIRITDIDENSHKFTPDQTVAAAFSDPNSIVNDGDILVARTGASVGKSYLYDKSDGDLIFAGFLMRFHPIEVISAYVYRQTLTGRYWQWIASESARSGQPGINIQQLKSFQIPVPPLAEQKKIAEVLSDVDELLAAMTTLIEKKRAIKQGAMQELLTGKKRLPGFGGKSSRSLRDKKSPTENAEIAEFKQTELGEIPVDWEVKRLGDCGFCFNGITGKSGNDFGHGKSRYITFLNVLTNIVIDSSILELVNICSNEKQNEVRQGDIFFNTSSETPEEVGLCAVLEEDVKSVYLNSFCFGFRITDNDVSGKFLAYWFRSAAGRTLMTTLAQGSTRYNLSKESFRGAYVCIPPSLAEQKAIAEVLSDMDAEIEALEAKRAKYESIKQGMMQELLTGKIRLEV